VEELAARQFGVFAVWQAPGLSPSGVRSRLARGRLHRVHRGVYAVGHPTLRLEGRLMAAVLACGPGAVLSHRSAAALWAIRPSARGTTDVTVLRGAGRSRPGIDVHLAREIDATTVDGIPVTTVGRTIVDLTEVLNRRGVEKAIQEAEYQRLFDLNELNRAMQGRRGAPVLTSLLAQFRGDTRTKSDPEELYLAIIRQADVPHPSCNVYVEGYERDFVWPKPRVIVEIDARSTHDNPWAWEEDRVRDQAATIKGWRVVRFTKSQLENEPDYVAAYTSSIVKASSPTSRNFV
jgi:very-short-patch-repair endonuclease